MRNIANGSLDGLPEGLRTVYVESNPASHLDTPVVEFVVADASLPQGTSRKAVVDMLTEVGRGRGAEEGRGAGRAAYIQADGTNEEQAG